LLRHVEECVVCQQLLESLTSATFGGLDAAAAHDRPAARFDSQPANWLPRQIGQYTLINEVGEGGMGVVYRAEQAKLKRSVAVKIIRHGVNATAGEVARFYAEAEAVARLQHPNIVQIFEVGSQEGVYFLALEYVSGGKPRSAPGWHAAGTASGGAVNSHACPSRTPRSPAWHPAPRPETGERPAAGGTGPPSALG